jgi:hypothetical protein
MEEEEDEEEEGDEEEGYSDAEAKDTDNKIQPKKQWVLPARAKPGRKPSETEPPTVSTSVAIESRG